MSVTSLVQGYNGTSWPKDKLGSCLLLEYEYFKHNAQFKTGFSNWSFSPGWYTVSFVCSLHLLRPKCPSCISFSIASCFLAGMTILVPFKIKPSSTVSSSLKIQFCCKMGGTCMIELGQLCMIVCFSKARSSSACLDTLSWCKLSLLAQSW